MTQIQKKKLSDFFKKKILLGNSYARITKKLKILKNLNFFGKLAYELPNKILILKKSDDFFFGLFSLFLKVFG